MTNEATNTGRTFILDDRFTLSIGKLNKWGYLREPKSGMITWNKRGYDVANTYIHVDVSKANPFIELHFMYEGNHIHQTINLFSSSSNLGIGKLWYFICPITGKRARKLFQIDGKFMHRDAHLNCLYFSQTLSRKDRVLKKVMDAAFAEEKLDDKHFTGFYKGKPTRKLRSVMNKVNKVKKSDIDLL